MKANYTWMQKLLWAISGNEVWIIKDCPTTYKYYSRQGLLFVMTFFFAAFCGAFAGHDFGNNLAITLFFGLIWGLLVYSIDQMMVQTINKVYVDGIGFKKKFWIYFFPRIFLGCLLALFMSSPLDHFIFKEQIENRMRLNVQSEWIEFQEKEKQGYDIEGSQNQKIENVSMRDSLGNAIKKDPNTTVFQDAKESYNVEKERLQQLKQDMNVKNQARNQAWNNIPTEYDTLAHKNVPNKSSHEYKVYLDRNFEYSKSITAYNDKVKEVNNYETTMKNERKKYENDLNAKIQKQDTIIDKITTKIAEDNTAIDEKTKENKEFLDNLRGFDTKFMTLMTLPNFGVQFLRWFIFLVFLMIEILPTWMKLMGKPTEYDIRLEKIKDKRKAEFESMVQQDEEIAEIKKKSEIQMTIDKEKQRQEIELENHKKILEAIADKQNNIAITILEEWEAKAKKELNL
jgi:hypothetical protein